MCGGNFETGLLWRDEEPRLPNKHCQAERRLEILQRKFSSNSGLKVKYRADTDDYIAKGHARKLSLEEASTRGPRAWYLTHFAVVSPNKLDKVRVVFDAAANHEGTSLNNNLLQ